jgi:hypothetical protein
LVAVIGRRSLGFLRPQAMNYSEVTGRQPVDGEQEDIITPEKRRTV